MPVSSQEVIPLFVEPFFHASIAGTITPEHIAFIKGLKMRDNPDNMISENKYIFEEPQLKAIKDAVQEVLDVYARDVLAIPQRLYVTQSWSLVNKPRVGMHDHAHSNSIVSGSLYYTDLPTPPGNMVFVRQTTYQQIDLPPEAHKRNVYNTPTTAVIPKKDEVFLFSSRLTHMVEHNATNQLRYSIAFNTFVKGTLGSYLHVSELKL